MKFIPEGFVPLLDAIAEAGGRWFPDGEEDAGARAAVEFRRLLHAERVRAVFFDEEGSWVIEPHLWATDWAELPLRTGRYYPNGGDLIVYRIPEVSHELFVPVEDLQAALGERRQSRAMKGSERAAILRLIDDPNLTRDQCEELVRGKYPGLELTKRDWNELFQEKPRKTGRRKKA